MIEEIRKLFREKFSGEPVIIRSPGRVNLIGEHTDYNDGFVLPAAIDKFIIIALKAAEGSTCKIYSADYQQMDEFPLSQAEPASGWKTYLRGMIHFVQQATGEFPAGINAVIGGNIPIGGGMSSSAAICCGIGMGLKHIFGLKISRLQIALLAQKTEHEYAGVRCGIMDQYAVLHGRESQLIRLDCRDISAEYIPFNFPDFRIVLVNTMVRHNLADSEYNRRREQCEQGLKILKQYLPELKSLRDLSISDLENYRRSLDEVVYRRCKYIAEETRRLLTGCQLLEAEDLAAFGTQMYEAHTGLKNDYEVSCAELDFLVAYAKDFGIIGARMMGGGFGGCTINLVNLDQLQDFSEKIKAAYHQRFNVIPEIYIGSIVDGTTIVGMMN